MQEGLRTSPAISASAPGRICLFGEHQDYLGLPVIAAAVNLRIGVTATPRSDALFAIEMPDTNESAILDPSTDQTYTRPRDYLRSCVNVLRRQGVRWPQGYGVAIRSGIPINAGVSSSSAMVVMWLRFLLEAADPASRLLFTADDLMRWGFEAEVSEFGEPGGMMDHACAALGGLLHIDTRSPFHAQHLSASLSGFVLGHSLEPKATLETLSDVRQDVHDGIARMHELKPLFDLATTPLSEVEGIFKFFHPGPARRLRANLLNRNITQEALIALEEEDSIKLGHLLTLHHAQLRDGLNLSTPKLSG